MSLTHRPRLLATGAAATALLAGGLALSPQTALAAPAGGGVASTTYSCDFGSKGRHAIPVGFALPDLPSTALAGVPIPAQPLNASLSLPSGLAGQLVGPGGSLKVVVDSLPVSVGFAQVPVSLSGPPVTVVGAADAVTLVAGGYLGGINPGAPGAMPIAYPASFDLGLQRGSGAALGQFPCTQPATTEAGTVQVRQQTAEITAKIAGKRVRPGRQAQVRIQVRRQVGVPRGTVVAKLGGRKIGWAKIKRGQAVMQLPALAVGAWKVTFVYSGDAATAPARRTITVRVRR